MLAPPLSFEPVASVFSIVVLVVLCVLFCLLRAPQVLRSDTFSIHHEVDCEVATLLWALPVFLSVVINFMVTVTP